LHVPSYLAGRPVDDYFTPPTPAFFNTHSLGFAYNPEAPAARWQQFLKELWADTACHALLHEWGGYCMTRDTSLQKYMNFIGVPRAGKGTAIHVLKRSVGNNVGAVSHRQILGKNGYEQLTGKQLAVFPDAKGVPKSILAEFCGVLCAITGEDEVTVDAKYEKLAREQLRLKIIIQLNEIMAIPDAANALKARQLFLNFTRTFENDPNLDPHLKDKLDLEIDGIAILFLLGLKRLHENGRIFTEPESSKALACEVQREATPCKAFLDDLCVVGSGHAVVRDEMTTAFVQWCKQREIEPSKTISADIRSACKQIGYVQSTDRFENCGTFVVAPRFYFTCDERDLGRRPYYFTNVRMKTNEELDKELGVPSSDKLVEKLANKEAALAKRQAHLAEHAHEKPAWVQKVIELERQINDHRATMKAKKAARAATYKTLTPEAKEQFKTEQKAQHEEDCEVFKRLRSELFTLYDIGVLDFNTPSREGMKIDADTPFDYLTFAKIPIE
jgi:P4 family phage/plasmid primase-like protien